MLRSLDIRDMLIIDRLTIEFQPGLNVLTGETGAGKSILLDALGFVLGWRGRAELVRPGAQAGEVSAVFDLTGGHPAQGILAGAGLPSGDGELILRRVNRADGRKTAWVNDRRVSGEVLRALSQTLVELHGQHDDRGLMNPRGHRRLLDDYGGLAALVAAARDGWRRLSQAQSALAEAEARLEAARSEEGFLAHAVEELDNLAPQPGEDATLDGQRRLMQSAGRIREDVRRAAQALGPDGAEGMLGDAIKWLETAGDASDAGGELLQEAVSALVRALTELGEAQQGVERCLERLDVDPSELEAVEDRLFAIRGLARKHGVMPDDLGAFAEDARTRLERIHSDGKSIARLEADVQAVRAAYGQAAAQLSDARRGAAERLDAAMVAELAPLRMERAVFRTALAGGAAGPEGQDDVSFTVSTNPGSPAGPLNRIASGGELSRFLLALKVCLSADQQGVTMIFDEIDRGVGGATSDAVGRRLKTLAGGAGAQVLVVTHSPQVAALGGHHWRVIKRVADGQARSSVVALSPAARVDELARMLSGDTVTDEARAAARVLLQG